MLDELIDTYEGGALARATAPAWSRGHGVDPEYRKQPARQRRRGDRGARLFRPARQGERMMVLENTPRVHQPRRLHALLVLTRGQSLGLPPVWYKSTAYRASAVNNSRRLLRSSSRVEHGPVKEVRVWDLSSEMRYFVIPERPAGAGDFRRSRACRSGHARFDNRYGFAQIDRAACALKERNRKECNQMSRQAPRRQNSRRQDRRRFNRGRPRAGSRSRVR